MAGKHIFLDERHRVRQHNAFAAMIIVGLLVVFAIWFVQIRLMVNTKDLAKVGADVEAARAAFGEAFK